MDEMIWYEEVVRQDVFPKLVAARYTYSIAVTPGN